MKDLRYLFETNKNFNENNTIIVDDLKEVLRSNKKNSIDSEYFNASSKKALEDNFLLSLIEELKNETLLLPPKLSVARAMIEAWYGADGKERPSLSNKGAWR